MTRDPATPTASVLVVESSTAIQRLLEVVLREHADSLFIVANPEEAGDVLETEPIDVVVLEPQGPHDLDWGLLDDLTATAIPAIVVTSRVDEQVEAEATRRGAAAFLSKPFMPAALQETVRDIIGTDSV